jgi:alpha-methylacyl-CoA racemase
MSEPLKPLAGIRVLDFTAFPPGGACTVMLADLGAEVIRIEPPAQKGKPSLVIGQVALSRGKRSITLDLRNPAANAVLGRLARTTDVVVENARPGAMEARGFGYSQAKAANPRLIWCAITGFGQAGPYAEHAGHDLSYVAHSGLLGALSTDRDFHPAIQVGTTVGAMAAVVGIQAALLERAKTDAGGFLDISISEAAGWLLTGGVNPFSDTPYRLGAPPDRRTYACQDGRFVAVASAEPRTWDALCDGLDAPDLKDRLGQPAQAADTTERLAALFRQRPAAEWVARLAPKGAAVTLMNDAGQVLDDPQVLARGSIVQSAGVPVPATPVRLSGADGRQTATATEPPHLVGQDTADVLASAGFTQDEIEALVGQAVA